MCRINIESDKVDDVMKNVTIKFLFLKGLILKCYE